GIYKQVNNLDLEVVDPANTLYRGNLIFEGVSYPGGGADYQNTVEVVFLPSPTPGEWTLRVRATNIPGAPSEPASTRQGYALVATYGDCNAAPAAPVGVVATDRGSAGIELTWNAVPG